jgi:REP element-mobilizing transposase RayT
MAGTFSQIHIHCIIAVHYRKNLIKPSWEEELYKYITGIIQNQKQKMLAINGMPDHIHFLIGMRPSCCLSNLMQEMKKSSNTFIKERFGLPDFHWQGGYGAFSHSKNKIPQVIRYIMNQKIHHQTESFKSEYIRTLRENGIEYTDNLLFEWIDD